MSNLKFQLKKRPKKYPMTSQQKKFIDALEFCGIEKGISKDQLMDKMRNCIPKYYEEHND